MQTAEEFIREKIRSRNKIEGDMMALHMYQVNGEDALRWAHEYASQSKDQPSESETIERLRSFIHIRNAESLQLREEISSLKAKPNGGELPSKQGVIIEATNRYFKLSSIRKKYAELGFFQCFEWLSEKLISTPLSKSLDAEGLDKKDINVILLWIEHEIKCRKEEGEFGDGKNNVLERLKEFILSSQVITNQKSHE